MAKKGMRRVTVGFKPVGVAGWYEPYYTKDRKGFKVCGYCGRDKPVCICGGRGITEKQYREYLDEKKRMSKLKKVM